MTDWTRNEKSAKNSMNSSIFIIFIFKIVKTNLFMLNSKKDAFVFTRFGYTKSYS